MKKSQLFLFLFLIIILLIFFNDKNFGYNYFAFVICILILNYNKFDFTNLISIIVLGHLIQFPIASLLANSQKIYASYIMSDSEFAETKYSMICLIIAMSSLFLGQYIFRRIFISLRMTDNKILIYKNIKTRTVIICFFFFIFYILLSILTHTYYHSSAGDVNYNASENLGFIGYFYYFGIISLVLQFFKYYESKSSKDVVLLYILLLVFEILMLPSGQRRFIILPIFVLFILFISLIRISFRTAIIFLIILPIAIFVLPILEYVRTDYRGMSMIEIFHNLGFIYNRIINPDGGGSPAFALLIRRLADFTSVGYVYDYIYILKNDLLGFWDLIEGPLYLLPTLIRPHISLSFAYDAQIMENIGFRTEINGSSPIMLIGDLLIRGGKVAIFFGFLSVGFLCEALNRKVNVRSGLLALIVWAFLMDYFSMIQTMTILKIFTLLTRHLFIFYIFSFFIKYINNYKNKKLAI
ncbi:hypothetical protein GALL_109190 [mine drainage metagenome]|uniref:O-antigen polysaccharide polymerase Wzy n=1 Tax=mine drainage metagenome TaxID=410659 RepID=A0A1J5SZH9_9ZZZZ